ncbi:MAG TPA: hypothetical protein PKA28_08120 [Methylomusa anaerophila]|uniref:WYL domain-containing protein n=1 Tax=Methylomusa anaerophila TaxID=1930071 RepID=A0A348ALC2_9FIRM|nr:hypothetical protein [Methylomusa anaerophila]BBB91870.1 hypothetical protein MAMMFC1_02555 [Methylomusa anaerophila]HML88399.1 hypothetical protein [Methylomusa anaerophila]
MNAIIYSAILENQVLKFDYEGGVHTVEPFCYGVSSVGEPVLQAYQIAGGNNPNDAIGWRLFKVSGMTNIATIDKKFNPRKDGYSSNPAISKIFCAVPVNE